MAKTLYELVEERKNVLDDMKEMLDRAEAKRKPLSTDERAAYDKLDAQVDRLNVLVRGFQKIDNLEIGRNMIINPLPGYAVGGNPFTKEP